MTSKERVLREWPKAYKHMSTGFIWDGNGHHYLGDSWKEVARIRCKLPPSPAPKCGKPAESMIPRWGVSKPFRPKRRKPRPGRLQGADMTELREVVWERDGPDCVRCGRRMVKYPAHPLQEDGYHLAHKIPRSRGGEDTPENTEACCMHCHLVVEHWGGKAKRELARTLLAGEESK